jgi:hypothetical protein
MACHVFLDAKEAGVLHKNQKHIADVCKVVHRGFAIVGITALIDEATGYQEIRDRLALQQILRKYISGALYEWSLTFPMEFYKEIFRLKGWEWNNGKMPGVVGRYPRDLVYSRLAPQVLEELERLNPPTEAGYRKYRHHQYLTRDVGHPTLTRRLYELIGMARAFQSWEPYYRLVDKTFPKMNTTLFLPMPDVDAGEEAAS